MAVGPLTIDTSVFINAFNIIEAGQETSNRLLAELQARGVPLFVPTLLLPELAAAIRRGHDDPDLARRFALEVSRLPNLTLIALDQLLAQQSLEVAARHRLRGSDAVYAAVALRYSCRLVTLDKEQHDRIASALETFTPAEFFDML